MTSSSMIDVDLAHRDRPGHVVERPFTSDNSVYAMNTDGGAPVAIAWMFASQYAIAVDANSVYFTDVGECDAGACSGAILKLTPK